MADVTHRMGTFGRPACGACTGRCIARNNKRETPTCEKCRTIAARLTGSSNEGNMARGRRDWRQSNFLPGAAS